MLTLTIKQISYKLIQNRILTTLRSKLDQESSILIQFLRHRSNESQSQFTNFKILITSPYKIKQIASKQQKKRAKFNENTRAYYYLVMTEIPGNQRKLINIPLKSLANNPPISPMSRPLLGIGNC